MNDLWTRLLNALGADVYAQHALCISNDPILMVLYVASDMTTSIAYIAMGVSLIFKRHLIAELNAQAIALYGAFILLCGLSHSTMTMTLFSGVYRLDIAVRAAMASVSAITAVYTILALWGDRDATQG